MNVAIVGRPNVGKSSLLNRLLREERVLVSEIPGTTRDAVDVVLKWHRRDFRIVDTAGIRRPGRVARSGHVDAVSVIVARRAIAQADVVVLVVDAVEGPTDQDASIAGEAHEAEILDDQGIDPCVMAEPELIGGRFQFAGEDEGVERDVGFDRVRMGEADNLGELRVGEVVGSQPCVEARQAEIDRIGPVGHSGAEAIEIARGRQELGLHRPVGYLMTPISTRRETRKNRLGWSPGRWLTIALHNRSNKRSTRSTIRSASRRRRQQNWTPPAPRCSRSAIAKRSVIPRYSSLGTLQSSSGTWPQQARCPTSWRWLER